MNNKQIKAAREALDSMDDYARMDSGVDAAGPRGVLVAFIDLVEAGNPASVATPTAAVAAGTKEAVASIDTPEFRELLRCYINSPTNDGAEDRGYAIIIHAQAASQKAREEAEARAKRAEEELEEWRFTNRIDELEREVNRLREQRTAGGDAVIISSYDIGKVKSLKRQFVDSLIHSGIQYRTCGAISATLNQIIDRSEAPQPVPEAAAQAGIAVDEVDLPPNLSHEEARAFILNVAEIVKSQWHAATTPAPVSAEPQSGRVAYENWELAQAERRKGDVLTEEERTYILKRWSNDRDTYNYCPHHWPAFQAGYRASLPSAGAPATDVRAMNNEWIERTALANGFKLKEQPDGSMALNPYVFDFARALLSPSSAGAPVSGAEQATDDLDTMLTVFDMGLGFALCHRDFASTRNAVKKLQADFADLRAALATAMRQQAPDWFKLDGDAAVIFGIRYSLGLLEDFGHAMPVDQPFVIKEREQDGALVVMRQQQGDGGSFANGYFCAVAVLLKETGIVNTDVRSMFVQGGDPAKADPFDIETFREYGLIPPIAAKQAGKN